MQLMVSRLNKLSEGLNLSIEDEGSVRSLGTINGNRHDLLGPVILFNIDQDILYGLSQPKVISRILQKGPQKLITTKDLAHRLYEHGMRSSLHQIKIGNNWFQSTIETFYSVSTTGPSLQLITGKNNKPGCLIKPREDYYPLIIASRGFELKSNDLREYMESQVIFIDQIQTIITANFDYVR